MNKAKAARMSRDLKFGFVGIGYEGYDFLGDTDELVKVVLKPKKYSNKNSMQERVRRHFAQW